jgi:hypothetical protein
MSGVLQPAGRVTGYALLTRFEAKAALKELRQQREFEEARRQEAFLDKLDQDE